MEVVEHKHGVLAAFLNSLSPANLLRGWKARSKNQQDCSMPKVERTMKAAILIQQWYRRYLARMEVRRRYTWTIFQSIEYQGEQDQVKLYKFFNALLTHIPDPTRQPVPAERIKTAAAAAAQQATNPLEHDLLTQPVDPAYKGVHLKFPLRRKDLEALIDSFRRKKPHRLHAKYVAGVLIEAVEHLKRLPNLNQCSTAVSKQVTICGDLHGKLDDLLVVFHKNGLPSPDSPYIFNGDFVDRGKKGLEVLLLLLGVLLVFPGDVSLNRGNHEDHVMNTRYGFVREVKLKYKHCSDFLLKLIEDVYRWLPLGTLVNNKVLVVHGGISDNTDLDWVKNLSRSKYMSLLRPPVTESSAPGAELIDKLEWKQVFDLLWSDPQPADGCIPNSLRGAGTYFGPDVTDKFLAKHHLSYIVRSHECKLGGYELTHGGKVVTIFSASNYYELGSNTGAYVTLSGPQLSPRFVQFSTATPHTKRLTFRQRVGLVESSALRELRTQLLQHREALTEDLKRLDPDNTGYVTVSQWSQVLEARTSLNLPWRMLSHKLVTVNAATGKVQWQTTFQDELPAKRSGSRSSLASASSDVHTHKDTGTVAETLYRNKSSLEAIFRIIDKDNSGYISLDEFSEACALLGEHLEASQDQAVDICRSMDMNKDGQVDLNEFLEAFRLVDMERHGPTTPDDDLSPDEPTNRE